MNYRELLISAASSAKNCACFGLDPVLERLPRLREGVYENITAFYDRITEVFVEKRLVPAGFKPNIGYFTSLDRPRQGLFDGSRALAALFDMLQERFPGVPVILDSKRGDIARSSANYAEEAFDAWGADALTVSPYMGEDSLLPFARAGKGVYVVCRSSNPGAADFQEQNAGGERLYMKVAAKIAALSSEEASFGAVAGATSPEGLVSLSRFFAPKNIPLLLPGVGAQGGSVSETLSVLRASGYDIRLARVNSSSAIFNAAPSLPEREALSEIQARAAAFLAQTAI